ncbi:Rieske (2Fe-2S) protein [Alicyclobacillus fodiniaquatilis]|uniref:Rieske (2Fe-2S) protein n=1 Tax=Alicyclobacillus fodiniaquatilis TaxID=1661150 RepID=A0ABW4JKH4_9BACL
MRHVICKVDALQPGEIKEAMLGRISIVICRTPDGEYYALSNRCVHQGAPMAKGKLCGATAPTDTPGEYRYVREGEILRCPWHGREYDVLRGGRMLADDTRCLPSFNVVVEGEEVVVHR